MSTPVCVVCGARERDAFLCAMCTEQLRQTIAEMPARIRDLEITATRQARTASSLQRRASEPEDTDPRSPFALVATALPFHPSAAHLLDLAINAVGTWARHVAEQHGVDCPASNVEACCTWLEDNIDAIRLDEAAGQMHARLTALAAEIDQVIDRRPPDLIHGRCEATVVRVVETAPGELHPYTIVCNTALYAPQGAESVECIGCGAIYRAESRQAMLDKVNDEWMRPKMIADALTARDEPISFDVLRKWIERDARALEVRSGPVCRACEHKSCRAMRRERTRQRGEDRPLILQVAIDDDGKPLYRIGDVRARIAWAKAGPERERMSA